MCPATGRCVLSGWTQYTYEYGASASEVTQTESYGYEKGELVRVEGQSDDSGTYTLDVTCGKGGDATRSNTPGGTPAAPNPGRGATATTGATPLS